MAWNLFFQIFKIARLVFIHNLVYFESVHLGLFC